MSATRITLALLLMAAAGCETADWSQTPVSASSYASDGQYLPPQSGPGLIASSQRWVPDVSMPTGFTPIPGRCTSDVLMHGSRRVIHLYQGRAAQAEVVAFYQKNLPLDGWRAYDRATRAGEEKLIFTKGVETLRLTVTEWDRRASVQLHIDQSRPTDTLSLIP